VTFSSVGLTADSPPKAHKYSACSRHLTTARHLALGTPRVTNQQVSYAYILRTGMTTGTFNTICVQEYGLLRVNAGFCWPEVVMMGTDLPLSMYIAPVLPLAMMCLLPILGQEE
jgi:hypothetical protein